MVAQACDENLAEFRTHLIHEIRAKPVDFTRLAKSIVSHLDSVGEGQAKRDRLKLLIDSTIASFRELLHTNVGAAETVDDSIPPHWMNLSPEEIASIIRRSMQAREHVDRMIGASPLVEAWLADLVCLSHA
jgi:hypothetical protein